MKNQIFSCLIAIALVTAPAFAWAETYVWQNVCDESQIANSGTGDGSTDSTATGFGGKEFQSPIL